MFLMSEAFRALDEGDLRRWDWTATTVLLVSWAWNPACDGAEALAGRRLVEALLAAGARVHVLASGRAQDEPDHPRYAITVVPQPPFAGHKIGRAWQMVRSTIPEAAGQWVRGAVEAGLRLLPSLPVDTIIYGRASPGSSNIVAWHLARATGAPWAAHFSDEWPSVSVLSRGRRWLAPYKSPLFNFWRRRIVRDAGAVTVTNPGQARDVLGPMAECFGPKTFVVTHLPSRRAPLPPPPTYDMFHLVHTGNFYAGQTSATLFQGLRLFLDRVPEARARVRLTQAGWSHGDVPAWTSRCGLEDVVHIAGHVSPSAVVDLVDRASLLIAIDYARADSRTLLSKLPDYIHAGRPILAITGADSSLARVFGDDGAGVTAHYDSPEEVAARIGEVFEAWRDRRSEAFLPRPTAIESFTRRRVLSELAGAFTVARLARETTARVRAPQAWPAEA